MNTFFERALDILVLLLQSGGLVTLLILAYNALNAPLFSKSGQMRASAQGLVFGFAAVASMAMPFYLAPGVFLDIRGVLVSLAAFFGGPIAGLIAASLAIAFRIYLRGIATLPGIIAIVAHAALGLLFRRAFFGKLRYRVWIFASLGLAVSCVTLLSFLLLPFPISIQSIVPAILPTLIAFPLASLSVGMFLAARTERYTLERRLSELESSYGRLVDNLPAMVVLKDLELRYVACNPRLALEHGLSMEQIRGRNDSDFFPPELAGKYRADDERVIASGVAEEYDEEHPRRGESRWVHVMKTPLKDPHGRVEGLLVLFFDVTERHAMEETIRRMNDELERRVAERTHSLEEAKSELESANEKLARLSSIDELTGVANRRAWGELLDREWRTAIRERHPLSIIMLDVDHFKSFNDHYGHQAGDACLRSIAHVIAGTLKRAGDKVARYGGEEFVVLLPNTAAAGALDVASAIRRAIAALDIPHEASAVSSHVTASLGCATVFPDVEGDPLETVREADRALYAAKHNGRDRIEVA